MIDFRYHLVSIVSIFLALAVGIVLGAGPLKEDIGTALTQEATSLRADKAQLRKELDTEKRGTAARDSYSAVVAPSVLNGQLTGRTVALVVTPGADPGLAKDAAASLAAAGARVGATITLTDAWADPAKRTFRNTLASQLAALVKAPLAGDSPDQLAATVLARAILGGKDLSTERLDPAARAALDGLVAGDLVKLSPDQAIPSSGVVFLGGTVQGSTQQETDSRLTTYLQLVRSLDAAGSGVVVVTASNATDPTLSSDLVAATRKDAETAKLASTVDDADLPMGLATFVFALAQQYVGENGHFGLAADAKAITPETAAKR